MQIDLSLLISIISVAGVIFFALKNYSHTISKDTETAAEERSMTNGIIMTKLENISDDVKEIKRDNNDFRKELNHLNERVAICENKLETR